MWQFFREVRQAVAAGNEGSAPQPYRNGTFMITARAGEVELTIKDITEEDAVLIAAELRDLGARAVIRGSRICPACGRRVPAQRYCTACRTRLTTSGTTLALPEPEQLDPDETNT